MDGLTCTTRRGFTLVEFLVVIGIIAVLIGILLPVLAEARRSARRANCLANLHTVGVAIHAYAHDNGGRIPYGPKAPRVMTSTQLYPSTGAPTSLISLQNGAPVGLGLLIERHLASTPRVLFCPDADSPMDDLDELAKVGVGQAQCSYCYRHASVTQMFDPPGFDGKPANSIRLANLGNNRNSQRVRALVMDTQTVAPPGMSAFGIVSRTHHQRRTTSVLYSDGSVIAVPNAGGLLVLDLDDPAAMSNPFERMLTMFEAVDIAR